MENESAARLFGKPSIRLLTGKVQNTE